MKLLEATVQRAALTFLEKRYQNKLLRRPIFSKIEMRTKSKYGGKRADGLLVFKHWFWGYYVVSMEAKSFKTIAAMKPYRNDWMWVWNSIKAGFIISLISGAVFALFKLSDGYWQFVLPINVFAIGSFLYAYFTRNHFGHKEVSVVRQVKQYPANEQWLAFSQDSLKLIHKKKIKNLSTIARAHGIGILLVHQNKKVEILVKPKMRWHWGKDFIKYYSQEKKIKQHLE